MNLENIPTPELKQLQRAIETRIIQKERDDLRETRNDVLTLLSERGYTLQQILSAKQAKKVRFRRDRVYANPKDATQTWRGAGKRPQWVVDFIATGGEPSEIEITKNCLGCE